MSIISRRSLLKIAVGLIAFVPAGRALAFGESRHSSHASNQQPFSNVEQQDIDLLVLPYAEGEVLTIGDRSVVIKTGDRGSVTLHLSKQTDHWEGRYVKDIPTQVGDFVIAWGPRRNKQEHDVEKIWINLVNLQGTVSNIRQDADKIYLQHIDTRQGKHAVEMESRTLVAIAENGKVPLKNMKAQITTDQFVQVIGRKLKDGTILATDVYVN